MLVGKDFKITINGKQLIMKEFDMEVHTASGEDLDKIGNAYGVHRAIESDNEYREKIIHFMFGGVKMEHKKDYSLLRPFDLDAAKRGEKIIEYPSNFFEIEFKGALSNGSKLLIEFPDKSGGERYAYQVRMAPLCWIEGKPVYKGDVLYYDGQKFSIIVEGYNPNIKEKTGLIGKVDWTNGECCWSIGEQMWAGFESWTWTKPKQKREGWVNVYNYKKCLLHDTKEKADQAATCTDGTIDPDRVACIRIEWEE